MIKLIISLFKDTEQSPCCNTLMELNNTIYTCTKCSKEWC